MLMHASINQAINGSDGCLWHGQRQANIKTNAGLLSIGPLGATLSEILINIHTIFINANELEKVLAAILCEPQCVNTLRPRHNGHHSPDDICKCIFLNENVYTSIKISPKFVPKGLINNIPALVQIMAWRWPGDKPLSEPMMVNWRINLSPSLNELHNELTYYRL